MANPTTPFELSADPNPLWTSLADELTLYQEIQAQSGRMSFANVGTSFDGFPMYLVRVGYPGVPTDQDLRDKAVSMFLGVQHGDEPAGREAYFQFMRDLAFSTDAATQQYLEKHPVLFMATMNPDGFHPNRITGSRYNGSGESINGDWVAYAQPEVRAAGSVIQDFDPCIVIDIHMMPQDTPQFAVINSTNLSVDSGISTIGSELKDVMQAAAVTAGFTAGDYWGGDTSYIGRNSMGLGNAVCILSESPWNTSAITCKDAVAGNLAMINAIIEWHAVNDQALATVVANAKLSAVSDGASAVSFPRPSVDPTPLGYRLTPSEFAIAEQGLAARSLRSFAIDGSTDVYVPMAQAGKRILPFMVDAASGEKVVSAQRVYSEPVLSEPINPVYNARVYEALSGDLVTATLGSDVQISRVFGLSPTTSYQFDTQEQQGGDLSSWSSRETFVTAGVSNTFNLEWRDTATLTTTTITGTTDLFYDLTGLNTGEDYEWRVQESTGNTTSLWSAWSGFTTASGAATFSFSDTAASADSWSAACDSAAAISAAALASDNLFSIAAVNASVLSAASASDTTGDAPAAITSFDSAASGSAIVDAMASASGALTAGASASESWSAQAQVLANMLSGAAGSDEIARQTDSALTAAMSEGSEASDQFLAALESIVSVSDGSTACDAYIAVVTQLAGIASGAIASDTFSLDFGFPGAIQSGAISGATWLILATLTAELSDTVTASDLMTARATVSASLVSGAVASDRFAIVNAGIRYLVMGAITLRSALNYSVSINP